MRLIFQFHRLLKPFYLLLLCAPCLIAQTTAPSPTPMSSAEAVKAANALFNSANEEAKAAKGLQAEDEAKLTAYKAALNNRQWSEASKLLEQAIANAKRSVSLGESATGKFESAGFLVLNSNDPQYVYSSYLLTKAVAIRKRTEAYRELILLFQTTQTMIELKTPEAVRDAQPKMKYSQDKIRALDRAANEADDIAEKIRREHPDSFKS